MNRQALVETVGHRIGDHDAAETAVTTFVDVVTATVAAGEQVEIEGFGRWSRVQRPANRSVPPTYVPRFDADDEFIGRMVR